MRSKRSASREQAIQYTDESVVETDTFRMVCELDPERRGRIGVALKVADDAPNERVLARRIALRLLEPGHVAALWETADPIERTLLRAASASPRMIGRGTLVRCALDRRHSPAEIDTRLTRLEREGLLLWRDVGFSPGYSVAPEVAARVRAAAAGDTVGPATIPKAPGPAADHVGAFLDDVVTTLAFLKRGSYRVTRGGAVHAADLRRLGARLVFPEDVPLGAPAAATPAANEPFPTRLGLALDLVRRLLLVRFDPDDIKVDDRRVRQWLERPADEIRRDLLKAARREPWRHQREVGAVADFLAEREVGQWIYVEDVARGLEYHPDFLGCRPEQLRTRVQSGATYLCWLGVAAVSPEEVLPDAVSLTPLGARLLSDEPLDSAPADAINAAELDTKIHVLPTFEVMLPSAAPLATRYALETFADAEHAGGRGPMRTYKLDKRTTLQALKGGLPVETMIAFLSAHSTGVPDSVRISLEDWARSYGEYYFMNPTLLVCRDAAAAAAAKSDPRIAERVLGQLSPEILILSEGAVEPVRVALEAAGSVPRAGLEEVPPGPGSGTPDAKAPLSTVIVPPADRASMIHRFILKRATDRAQQEATDELDLRKAKSLEQTLQEIGPEDRPADAPDAGASGPEVDRRASKLCLVTGCARPHAARGLCTLHYQAARRGKMSFPSV